MHTDKKVTLYEKKTAKSKGAKPERKNTVKKA